MTDKKFSTAIAQSRQSAKAKCANGVGGRRVVCCERDSYDQPKERGSRGAERFFFSLRVIRGRDPAAFCVLRAGRGDHAGAAILLGVLPGSTRERMERMRIPRTVGADCDSAVALRSAGAPWARDVDEDFGLARNWPGKYEDVLKKAAGAVEAKISRH